MPKGYISHRRMCFSHSLRGIYYFRSISHLLLRLDLVDTFFSGEVCRELSSDLRTAHKNKSFSQPLRIVLQITKLHYNTDAIYVAICSGG